MKQLKEKQQVKEGPEWGNMNQRQQQEFESNLRQIGMIARYHNVMGRYTIHSLELITREIKTTFCHAMMVDRIAGMLNYFLVHLVCVIIFNIKCSQFYFDIQIFKAICW